MNLWVYAPGQGWTRVTTAMWVFYQTDMAILPERYEGWRLAQEYEDVEVGWCCEDEDGES